MQSHSCITEEKQIMTDNYIVRNDLLKDIWWPSNCLLHYLQSVPESSSGLLKGCLMIPVFCLILFYFTLSPPHLKNKQTNKQTKKHKKTRYSVFESYGFVTLCFQKLQALNHILYAQYANTWLSGNKARTTTLKVPCVLCSCFIFWQNIQNYSWISCFFFLFQENRNTISVNSTYVG